MAFRFRKFKVYQDAKSIYTEIVFITKTFPREHLYLTDQIRRSSLSILLNIAEGSSKQSDKDFNRFITIALGSVDETVAAMEVATDLNLVNRIQFETIEKKLEEISRQLGGLSKKLKVRS